MENEIPYTLESVKKTLRLVTTVLLLILSQNVQAQEVVSDTLENESLIFLPKIGIHPFGVPSITGVGAVEDHTVSLGGTLTYGNTSLTLNTLAAYNAGFSIPQVDVSLIRTLESGRKVGGVGFAVNNSGIYVGPYLSKKYDTGKKSSLSIEGIVAGGGNRPNTDLMMLLLRGKFTHDITERFKWNTKLSLVRLSDLSNRQDEKYFVVPERGIEYTLNNEILILWRLLHPITVGDRSKSVMELQLVRKLY